MNTAKPLLTNHATYRKSQRGISNHIIEFVFQFHDKATFSHGAEKVYVSKKFLNELVVDDSIADDLRKFIRENFARIINTILVISSELVLTVY